MLVGCGLGGTSLINANVAARGRTRASSRIRVWPQADPRTTSPTALAEGLARAREMLRPTPYPEALADAAEAHARSSSSAARDGARAFCRTPINVTFTPTASNHVGVPSSARAPPAATASPAATYGAKNTMLDELPARRGGHGAEIFTQRRGALDRARADERWLVHYQLLGAGREAFDAPTLFVSADVVVRRPPARSGRTEILLRSKAARAADVGPRSGERFTGNGDVLGVQLQLRRPDQRRRLRDATTRTGKEPVGPTITGDDRPPRATRSSTTGW